MGWPEKINRAAEPLTAGPLEVALAGRGVTLPHASAGSGPSKGDAFLTGGGGRKERGHGCAPRPIDPPGRAAGELSRPAHLCGQSRGFSLPCRPQRRTAPASPPQRPLKPGGSPARAAWVGDHGLFLPTAASGERTSRSANSRGVGGTGAHRETSLSLSLSPHLRACAGTRQKHS